MSHVRHIGIAVGDMRGIGLLQQLERGLAYASELGFQLVEIDISPFTLIINGELHRPRLENFLAVIRHFDLHYTIHGLMRLNLAYDPRHDLCRQIMRCQIEVARAMKASCIVYHSGLQALDDARHGVRRALLSDAELVAGAQQEIEALKSLAPLAADAGVLIGVENGDPHQWEYDLMARLGHPASDLLKHHARLRIEPVVEQLEVIAHPNIAMTLDVGHLFIAARAFDFDFMDAIRKAAPWTKHIHAHDNFGRLDRGFGSESDRWPFGEADLHMPPGWGEIPLRDVFAAMPDYDRDVILEIKPGFVDYFGEALETTQKIIRES
ncbi:MAG: sugar phosphate isomerase/epimerase [Anaerolineae bacterium]|nr:sugar phosphate isomerase/epimerase [Anaerolineae bacterium]